MTTALFGYGKIGRLIANSMRVDCIVEINQSYQLHSDDTIIWAATNGWPHGGNIDRDLAMMQEFQDFMAMISNARKNDVRRIIFCSTFGVEFNKYGIDPDYYDSVDPEMNFYVAGKKAAEMMLKTYAAIVENSSCSALRIGWYAPNQTTDRSDLNAIKQSDDDLLKWVSDALNAPSGYHCVSL